MTCRMRIGMWRWTTLVAARRLVDQIEAGVLCFSQFPLMAKRAPKDERPFNPIESALVERPRSWRIGDCERTGR